MLLEEFRSAASFFEQDGLCFFFFFFNKGAKAPKKNKKENYTSHSRIGYSSHVSIQQ
jgi:hypothetical protein